MAEMVLLVDDDVELSAMLKEYLERDGFGAHTLQEGDAAVAAALSGRFSIVILDVMMPGCGGIDVLRQIRRRSSIPVLMLTARGDDDDRILGLELGADDYVPKPCTPRELAARIRAILRRLQSAGLRDDAGGPITSGDLTLWPQKRVAHWRGRPLVLTSTEFNLLEVLARNAGHAVSKGALSEQGLGRLLAKFDRSIDVHMSSLRHKLGPRPGGDSWIQNVRGMGYQLVKE
jgi:DNA-binding response OmpR family regulator